MAIKFSQFVVQTDASTLSHIVGYDGADNIQITPTNFLNSLLTGTAGQVLFYDTTGVTGDNGFYWDNTNKRLGIGTATPSTKLQVNGTITADTHFTSSDSNATLSTSGTGGVVRLRPNGISSTTGQVVVLDSGNVGIGTATPTSKLEVDGDMSVTPGGVILLPDNSFLRFGTSSDATIYHDATDTYFKNFTGDLIIQNNKEDKDIIFQTDDGAGGVETYFFLDGSASSGNPFTVFPDNAELAFGDGRDFRIKHTGSTYLSNAVGDLYFRQQADDSDMIFQCDDGAGGVIEYFRLDGGAVKTIASKNFAFLDSIKAEFGDSGDLQIYHNATNSLIENSTGHLYIKNSGVDKDIIFEGDNGSGGVTEYFKLDGSDVETVFSIRAKFIDNTRLNIGSSRDLVLFHNGTDSFIINETGNLKITQGADNADIIFEGDDGSGGTGVYFLLDGSLADGSNKFTRFLDRSRACFGDAADLQIFHNGTNSYIESATNDLLITNYADDGDIKFYNDDGSGGVTEYFRLDGGDGINYFFKDIKFLDDGKIKFGTSSDLQIYHSGASSSIRNQTGDLYIQNFADDSDIVFQSDDGSGGVTEYFRLDGGSTLNIFYKPVFLGDGVKSLYGNSSDLQIYHDGNHSYIQDTGTGVLKILGSGVTIQNASGSENMAVFTENDTVILYNNGVEKIRTIGSGVRISGVSEYADNTAALAAGLVVGDVYRTGDDLKIVH